MLHSIGIVIVTLAGLTTSYIVIRRTFTVITLEYIVFVFLETLMHLLRCFCIGILIYILIHCLPSKGHKTQDCFVGICVGCRFTCYLYRV